MTCVDGGALIKCAAVLGNFFVAPPPTLVPPATGVRCYGVTFERKFPIENPKLKKKREARKIQRADFSGELTLLFRFGILIQY